MWSINPRKTIFRNTGRPMVRWVSAAVLVPMLLAGCATEHIVVSEAALTDDPDARVVGWLADEASRQVFSPEDEEVTLRALFALNYRGIYEWYKVEWIAPDGSPYKVVSLRTAFGSHRDIKATLEIRGKMASRMPGLWRARLWLLGREGEPDRLLVSRLFRIAEATPEMLAAGLTPVDEPGPDAYRPLVSAPASSAAAASADSGVSQSPPGEEMLLAPLMTLLDVEGRPLLHATSGAEPATGKETFEPEHDVVAVSLTSRPAEPGAPLTEPGRRDYPGCPPLYYPPGPGCVEQAPEE